MSDKQAKRPAHSVIVTKLRELAVKYREQIGMPTSNEVEIAATFLCMRLLVSVLWDMVIPEKERELLVRAIEEIADITNVTSAPTESILFASLVSAIKEA